MPRMKLSQVETLTELVKYMYEGRDSVFIVILGRKRSAKTTLAFNISLKAHALDYMNGYGANVPDIRNAPYDPAFINNLQDLIEWARTIRGNKWFLLDELARNVPKRRSLSKMNVELLQELQVIRKDKLFLVGCGIGREIDRGVLTSDHCDFIIEKYNEDRKGDAMVYDLVREEKRPMSNLGKSPIKFPEYYPANFTAKPIIKREQFHDTDLKHLFDYAQGGSIKETGLHPQEFRRILKKFLTETLKDKVKSEAET